MKMHQIDTEHGEYLKSFQFSKVLCIFVTVSTDFVNWSVKKCQQGKNVLSSLLRKEMNAVFRTKIIRNRHRKFSDFFTIFVQFLSNNR